MEEIIMQLYIEYGTKVIPFQLEYRKRKTMEIRIKPPEEILVVAPKGISKENVIKAVQGKADWIVKKLSEYESLKNRKLEKDYIDGESFLYLGNNYPLQIIEAKYKIPRVMFEENAIKVYIRSVEDENIKKALEKWYRDRALEVIVQRIKYYQQYFKVSPTSIVVKEQKRRWGSCTSKRKILFNWKLIMAPLPVIDYVVVHEMCHLVHMNHSKDFWNLVESILPDYKERKKWLKLNGILMEI